MGLDVFRIFSDKVSYHLQQVQSYSSTLTISSFLLHLSGFCIITRLLPLSELGNAPSLTVCCFLYHQILSAINQWPHIIRSLKFFLRIHWCQYIFMSKVCCCLSLVSGRCFCKFSILANLGVNFLPRFISLKVVFICQNADFNDYCEHYLSNMSKKLLFRSRQSI